MNFLDKGNFVLFTNLLFKETSRMHFPMSLSQKETAREVDFKSLS